MRAPSSRRHAACHRVQRQPGAQAKAFANAGCEWLHLVDLNGAVEGNPVNRAAVERDPEGRRGADPAGRRHPHHRSISQWFDAGVARVILGTIAVKEPGLVKAACKQWPGRIAVGIDARDGMVAVDGWPESTGRRLDLALQFEEAGVAAIIYTDIDRDGVLAGINWDSTIALADAVSIPVIASGGLASLDDIRRMTMPDARKLAGAISGRALYDGRIDPAEALKILGAAGKGS